MKKLITLTLTCLLLFGHLTLSAYEEFKLKPVKENNRPFVIRPLIQSDSDDGVKGKIMVTAGVGFNIFATLLEARYYLSPYYSYDGNISSSKATPMFNVAVDYGFARKFSVGAAFGYQTAKVNLKDIVVAGDQYTDTWRRIHFAVRGDYYIVAKENLNLYTGLKLGYNVYTVSSTVPEKYYPNYVDNMNVTPQPASVQAHFGFSYYFMDMIGFNTEIGIGVGGPYLFAAGLAVKL